MPLTAERKRVGVRIVEPVVGAVWRLLKGAGMRRPRLAIERVVAAPSSVGKILVVRLDTIGDVLLTEPAIAALAKRFDRAEIHLLASAPGAAILANNPAVHEFHVYDPPWHAAWRGGRVRWSRDLKGLKRVVGELRRERFDLAFELRGDVRDSAVAGMCGARLTIAGPMRGGGQLVDHAVAVDADAHRVRIPLDVVAALGVPGPADPFPRLYPSGRDVIAAGEALADSGRNRVALHLCAGFESKQLPVNAFVRIVRGLSRRDSGLSFVVVGGEGERALVDELIAGSDAPVVDLAGRLSLLETAAVLERCRIFIGNDSGPMHIAASVGTPVIAFFGPSEPRHYRPLGSGHRLFGTDLDCSPCDHVHCVQRDRYLCMKQMDPEEAVSAALELVGRVPAGAGAPDAGKESS